MAIPPENFTIIRERPRLANPYWISDESSPNYLSTNGETWTSFDPSSTYNNYYTIRMLCTVGW